MKTRILYSAVVALLAIAPAFALPPIVHAETTAISAPSHTPVAPLFEPSALLYAPALMGAIRIKDTGSLAKKFVTRAGAASKDYEEGVKAAGADWEKGAREGAENYRQAVTQAAAEGRFEKGVAAAGAAKFVQRASTLGPQRFQTGVNAAEGEWAKGTQPYLDALKSVELPPRRPRGQNAARAQAVADRLHQMRVGK